MFDIESFIQTVGYIGIWMVVFSESGLLIGFFLPGDSFLFTAGVLASQNFLNIWILIPLVFSAAILGDNIGYAFGCRIGPKLFKREDSFFFHKKHLMRAELLYEKYGPKIIVLARFMPVVRTFAPIVAGIGKMNYKTFLLYNLVGGTLWGIGMPLFGYFLGATIPGVHAYMIHIIIVIIFLSILPGIIHAGKAWLRSRN
jgi:membrane-associated protein